MQLFPSHPRPVSDGNTLVFKFGITYHDRSKSEVIIGQAQSVEQRRVAIYRFVKIPAPTGSQAYACREQIKEAKSQCTILSTEGPVFIAVGNYDMRRASANAFVALIPRGHSPAKPHCFGLFLIISDNRAHPVDDHTGQSSNLRRFLYHNPMPGLLVFGRRGGTGYFQELFQDGLRHRLFFEGPY